MIAFDNLLDCPAGPTPLLDNEKQMLKAEFLPFTLNVPDASATLNASPKRNFGINYSRTRNIPLIAKIV